MFLIGTKNQSTDRIKIAIHIRIECGSEEIVIIFKL